MKSNEGRIIKISGREMTREQFDELMSGIIEELAMAEEFQCLGPAAEYVADREISKPHINSPGMPNPTYDSRADFIDTYIRYANVYELPAEVHEAIAIGALGFCIYAPFCQRNAHNNKNGITAFNDAVMGVRFPEHEEGPPSLLGQNVRPGTSIF
jgi:hypothetical protein